MKTISLLVALLILNPSFLVAQKEKAKVAGDAGVVENVEGFTSKVYDATKGSEDFTTKLNDIASRITQFKTGLDKVARLLVVQDVKRGTLSSEWYFRDGMPVFLYRTFEFSGENPKEARWKNFKGKWAWEARVYFEDGRAAFQKVLGRPVASEDELLGLRSEARQVLKVL